MIHEAVVWSNVHKKWFFLPRKASKSKYNDVDDERHGTNLLLVAGDQVADAGNNLQA
jgi:soluble calcium-activated nucleotidase 1